MWRLQPAGMIGQVYSAFSKRVSCMGMVHEQVPWAPRRGYQTKAELQWPDWLGEWGHGVDPAFRD